MAIPEDMQQMPVLGLMIIILDTEYFFYIFLAFYKFTETMFSSFICTNIKKEEEESGIFFLCGCRFLHYLTPPLAQ